MSAFWRRLKYFLGGFNPGCVIVILFFQNIVQFNFTCFFLGEYFVGSRSVAGAFARCFSGAIVGGADAIKQASCGGNCGISRTPRLTCFTEWVKC